MKLVVFASILILACSETARADEPGWKAGISKVVITPEHPTWMAGYGGRTRPAEEKIHDLHIRVVALQDQHGHQGVILSSDLLGIPQSVYQATCQSLKQKHDLNPDQIMLHSSHTHCGPLLRGFARTPYPMSEEQYRSVEKYTDTLEKKIVEAVGDALAHMVPAKVSGGQGLSTFAVNRRNNHESLVPKLRQSGELQGPVDHSVPVLAVRSLDNKLMAVVFGYACHNTNLGFYKWCGDYAGFAQYALEDIYPDAVAMFYMGCGADQNPIPRRTIEKARSYGLRLAGAVEQVLAEPMQEYPAMLQTELEVVTLNFGTAPAREDLVTRAAAGTSYLNRWAADLLKELDAGKPLERTYPYPLQAWRLGEQQLWIAMGGEAVVDYSLGFKKRFGNDTWVASYCNDVMAYIPSLRVLDEDIPPLKSKRWGYEGNTSMMAYGRGAERWADDVETLITDAADRLVRRLEEHAEPIQNTEN